MRHPHPVRSTIKGMTPTELHAAVLAAIDGIRWGIPGDWDRDIGEDIETALRRIAERHHPGDTVKWAEGAMCLSCTGDSSGWTAWPCDDFLDVAAAVGIEVPE